jgi:hypothetical protein
MRRNSAQTASGRPFRARPVPPPLPAWLTEADVDYYTSEFTRTGFRGGLNWYRNIDRNWELLAPFDGIPVRVPALYIAGDRDPSSNSAEWTATSPTCRNSRCSFAA